MGDPPQCPVVVLETNITEGFGLDESGLFADACPPRALFEGPKLR